MSALNFNAASVVPLQPLEPVPTGWYVAKMTSSELKPTSDGKGSYLQLEYTILSGEHAGRKLFDRLNLQNANANTQEIAWRSLSAICHAVGVIQVQDSQQLHDKPLQVRAVLRPAGPGADGKHYEASNEIRGYKALEGAGVGIAGGASAPAWATGGGAPEPAAPAFVPAPQAQAPAPTFAPAQPAPVQEAPAPTFTPAPAAAPAPAQAAPAWTPPTQPAGNGAPVPPWAQAQS